LHFDDERVIVLRPPDILASNTRSHFYAIHNFKRDHGRLTIIDSDNLVDPEYLNALNYYFDQGYLAVQGIREAKNLNTAYACLDAARDIYYHFYDGKILFKIGSSATLAGSGMAFTTQLYRDCLEHLDITGAGFDKVLQAAILGRDIRIAFTGDAIVYDEKTSDTGQLVNQRSRWINTWFRYFKFGFAILEKGISNGSWNQFVFGLVLLRPPLFIFLLISVMCLFVNLFIGWVGVALWAIGFLIFIIGFYIALTKSHTDERIYRSLVNIPKFIFYQVLSLLKARKANQRSVATRHTYNNQEDQNK
jgi:cellulose synthase/poly-beta-1,6-N-acetylglucosamine synthase-like glycosyltransferase